MSLGFPDNDWRGLSVSPALSQPLKLALLRWCGQEHFLKQNGVAVEAAHFATYVNRWQSRWGFIYTDAEDVRRGPEIHGRYIFVDAIIVRVTGLTVDFWCGAVGRSGACCGQCSSFTPATPHQQTSCQPGGARKRLHFGLWLRNPLNRGGMGCSACFVPVFWCLGSTRAALCQCLGAFELSRHCAFVSVPWVLCASVYMPLGTL